MAPVVCFREGAPRSCRHIGSKCTSCVMAPKRRRDFQALVQEHCGPCAGVDSRVLQTSGGLREAAKHMVSLTVRQLVANAAGAPTLTSYSSNGAPLSTKRRFTASWGPGVSATRTGKGTDEFLVQHDFYKCVLYPQRAIFLVLA